MDFQKYILANIQNKIWYHKFPDLTQKKFHPPKFGQIFVKFSNQNFINGNKMQREFK